MSEGRLHICVIKRRFNCLTEDTNKGVYIVEDVKTGEEGILIAYNKVFIVITEGHDQSNMPAMYEFREKNDLLREYNVLYDVTSSFQIRVLIDENKK